MKELLYRYYLIKLSDYKEDTKDSLYFTINDKKYHFFVVHRDLEEIEDILKITDDLLKRNVLIYSPIKNINGSFITIENNNYYVLLDESGDNKEITLLEIIDFTNKTRIINNIKSKLYRNDWYTLWQEKINYLEYQVSELGKQYPVIVSSFSYYRGLSENALCYVKYLENKNIIKNDNLVISHQRMHYLEYANTYLNPFSIVIDRDLRDISEYLKSMALENNNYALIDLKTYMNLRKPSFYEASMLYARLIFPTYYFDKQESIINNNDKEDDLLKIIIKKDQMEDFLNEAYKIIQKYQPIDEIVWLNKSNDL